MLGQDYPQQSFEQKRNDLIGQLIESCAILIKTKNWGKLNETHRKIIAIDSKSAAIYVELARHCMAFQQYEQAQKYCEKALEIDHSCSEAHSYLEEIFKLQRNKLINNLMQSCIDLIEKRDWERLTEIHRKIIAIDSKNATIYVTFARHCMIFQQYEQAQKYCEKAIEIDPSCIYAHFYIEECSNLQRNHLIGKLIQLCNNLIESKNWSELVETHRKILAVESKSVATYLEFARHCMLFQQYEQMQKYCEKALEIDADSIDVNFYLGESCRLRGNYKKAFHCYHYVILKNSRHAAALYGRAHCYVKNDDYDEALVDLTEAHALCKDNSQLQIQIRELYDVTSKLFTAEQPKASLRNSR